MPSQTLSPQALPSYAIHLFPPHSYPLPPPPPVIAHHVWILDCSHCRMFLTNRAMKAVLLLRPNVALYSSDVLPINCSTYAPRPAAYPLPSASPSSARTCDCLTQSLHCHGCGHTIGYMIVIPCVQCTSSISTSHRATNGHRFVFHSTEVTGTKRYYVLNEPGVIKQDIQVPRYPLVSPHPFSPEQSQGANHLNHEDDNRITHSIDYLPTPPLELDEDDPESSPEPSPISEVSSVWNFEMVAEANPDPAESVSPERITPLGPLSFTAPSEIKETYRTVTLKDGDFLYWHHLARTGEIPGVFDDDRSRTPARKEKKSAEASSHISIMCGR